MGKSCAFVLNCYAPAIAVAEISLPSRHHLYGSIKVSSAIMLIAFDVHMVE